MDLLSNNLKQANSVSERIFAGLKELKITPEEMNIAENFFDFSAELDISLLDHIKCREFNNVDYDKCITAFAFIENQKSYLYCDRFILFLDALMGNLIHNAMYSYRNLGYWYNKDKAFQELVNHAYAQRYDEIHSQAKLAAIFADECTSSLSASDNIRQTAQSSPEALYIAFKNYCVSNNDDAKLKLAAVALAYSSPNREEKYLKIKNKIERAAELPPEHAKEMAEFIVDYYDKNFKYISNDDSLFSTVMSAMFMAIDFDERIEGKILEQNVCYSRNEEKAEKFLMALCCHLPNSYFDANLERIDKLIELDGSEKFTEDCIKAAICAAWGKSGYDDYSRLKAKMFIMYCVEHYPKTVVTVMKSTDRIDNANIYYNYYCQSSSFCCGFYHDLFTIFKEINPVALTEYKVNYNEDILNLLIKTEFKFTSVAHKEIEKYLRGEAELSILEPYFDTLEEDYKKTKNSSDNNYRLVSLCMEHFPNFKKRYLCFKAIQSPALVSVLENFRYINDESKLFDNFNSLMNTFNEEKVPIEYRFGVYNSIHDGFYSDRIKDTLNNLVTKEMIARKSEQDTDYKKYCPKGSVFARKAFVKYLVATNDENNGNKPEIIKMFGDSSKEIRRTVVTELSDHKEFESDVIELLKAKKAAVRESAVDVLVLWGAENYKETLLETADNEKSAKLADRIRDILSVEKPVSGDAVVVTPKDLVESLHKGGRNKKILWLYSTPAPTVHFKDGSEADDKYMQAIMLCYANMTMFGISDQANILAAELNEDELKAFSSEMLSRFLSDGAESKKKWVLNFAAIHGGSEMIDVFLHYIKEWSENMRGAIAADAVKALAMNGSSQALMAIDNMAHKFKHKQVKNAAVVALDSAAEALGITSDQLADKIVPDLGFEENMQRIFDYGTRKFKVYLTPTLELEVFDENDKKLKNIPAPGKRDDEETAKKSNAEFKAMKKQLRNVISIQKMRLETALLADRRWEKSAWEELFVKNPVMHSFAIGLIWASYENDTLSQTFRYTEEGTFNTFDEDEYELPENAVIGLVHPIDLDEDTLSGWKEQLEDYEITQPIEQLNRPVYRIEDDEIGKLDLTRFEGRAINGMSLLGRTAKYGWQKGSVQDAGCFCTFYREDITKRTKNEDGTFTVEGNAVELNFEGMYVGGDDSDVSIEKVRFYKPGTVSYGSYVYDHADDSKAIPLDKISPRYFSEIVNQIELITKTAEKKD